MLEKKIIPSGKAILLSLPENQRTVIQRCIRVLFILAGKLKKSSGLVFLGLLNRKKMPPKRQLRAPKTEEKEKKKTWKTPFQRLPGKQQSRRLRFSPSGGYQGTTKNSGQD